MSQCVQTHDSVLIALSFAYPQEVLDNVREMSGVDQQDPNSAHARVARRLKEMADEFEREHLQEYSRWETIFATVFGFPRPDVVQTFMRFVKEVQEDEFSWSFLIRFFFFGFKLLQGLSPATNCMDEQQSELVDIFMSFLMDRLTTWIQSQGGWVRRDCEENARFSTITLLIYTCFGLRRN